MTFSNIHRLPKGVTLWLTDYSEGMLAQAKKALEPYWKELEEKEIRLRFEVADAYLLQIAEKMAPDRSFYIHKETGIFICR